MKLPINGEIYTTIPDGDFKLHRKMFQVLYFGLKCKKLFKTISNCSIKPTLTCLVFRWAPNRLFARSRNAESQSTSLESLQEARLEVKMFKARVYQQFLLNLSNSDYEDFENGSKCCSAFDEWWKVSLRIFFWS